MSTLFVLIGVSKSGKTTFCEKNISESRVHISSDKIRKELFESSAPEDYNPKDNNIVFDIMFKRTIRELKDDKDVLYDATNLVRKRRKHLVEGVRAQVRNVNVVAVLVMEEIEVLLDRAEKDGFPEEVIMKQLSSFQIPTLDVFDDIQIKNTPNKTLLDYLSLTEGFNQLTPYHDFTLEKHIRNCHWEALKLENWYLEKVALWHDIGKLYTQKVDEKGIASYYNHANVSAYLFLNSLKSTTFTNLENILEIAGIIQEHMNYKNIKTDKAKEKLLERSFRTKEWYHEKFKIIDNISRKEE